MKQGKEIKLKNYHLFTSHLSAYNLQTFDLCKHCNKEIAKNTTNDIEVKCSDINIPAKRN